MNRKHILLVEDNPKDEERDCLRNYENGANSFVRKPLDFTEFAETVACLGIYWLATSQPPKE
jgi:DNA-binding response OmpR family regulator